MDKTKYNELLDFYEQLLTAHQQKVMDYYYREDLSISEISENLAISRAAVNDIIKRVKQNLLLYEKKLQLIKKHHQRLILTKDQPELSQQLQEIEEGE